MNEPYKNILVIRTDRIGDVILTTPALKALRIANPSARISLLVTPVTQPLMLNNFYVDEIIVDDRENEHKGTQGFLKLVQTLRLKKFDLAVNFHAKKRANSLMFFAGIPHRLAFDNRKWSFLLNHKVHDVRHHGEKHEVDYCLDLLEKIHVKSQGKELYVSVDEEAEQWVKDFKEQNNLDDGRPFVLLHPGASDIDKTWPPQNFGSLADCIIDQYQAHVFLVGAMETRTLAHKIKSISHHLLGDLSGVTSITQLVSLIKNADLLVSNDSGPVHIASAVHTPVISIFTRNKPGINPERWQPLGDLAKSLYPPPDTEFKADLSGSKVPEINEFISISDVLEEVDAFLKV